MLLLYILLALIGQQTTVNGQQTPFLESENLKTSESEKGSEQQTISNEPFLESEKSVNISEICGNEKTNHKLAQKKSEKSCEQRTMSNETFLESENLKTSESELETENLKTSKSEKGQKIFQVFSFSDSQIQKDSQVFSFSVSQILYFENQIRLADSLYKNYLPQYNFEEVKAAVMFFDSLRLTTDNSQRTTDFFHRFRKNKSSQYLSNSQTLCNSDAYPRTVDRCPLSVDIEYLRARAHYYHAVGLTDRDDIVGACEHYFKALEIMEDDDIIKSLRDTKRQRRKGKSLCDSATLRLCDSNKEDYEKIRFIALIYTRLGRLFLNENYCDLAILKYKKALKYDEIIDEKPFNANVLKELGNSYQLASITDSALYCYNESLRYDSSLINKLDVEKSIAQILFNKGEKDTAYLLIKNNLDNIENNIVKDSYSFILGEMYFVDKVYDSAIYYLERSFNSQHYYTRLISSRMLSVIYDSICNIDKKAYYDDIVSKLSIKSINKSVDQNKLQTVYDNYNKRKIVRERAESKRKTIVLFVLFSVFVILTFIVIILITYRNKIRRNNLLDKLENQDNVINKINDDIRQRELEIDEYSKMIEEKKGCIVKLEKELKEKEQELSDRKTDIDTIENVLLIKIDELEHLKEELSLKNKTIEKQQKEFVKLKQNVKRINESIDFDGYYNAEICKRILGRKKSDFTALTDDELALLLDAADQHLGVMTETLSQKYPRLRKEDMYCISLILLNTNKSDYHYLLGRNRKTIWERINRIKSIMNIDDNKDLFLSIKDVLYR